MSTTTAMSVQDALWLTMDRPNNLMVVDGAMMLRGVPTEDDVAEIFTGIAERYPVFRRRPVRSGNGWAWEDDPDFHLDRHLERRRFDEPLTMAEVQEFLAAKRSEPLSKDQPLWRSYIMHPVMLDDGTLGSAIINRFHHAIADGVRLTQLMLSMCDTEEAEVAARVARTAPKRSAAEDEDDDTTVIDVAWSAAEEVTSAAVHGVGSLASGMVHALRHPVSTVVHAPGAAVSAVGAGLHGVEEGISLVRHPDRLLDAIEELGVDNNRGTNDLSSLAKIALGQTERTVWTGEPGDVKSLAWSEQLPLDQIKTIGRARGATVNDVLLAAVAGGLRRYLDEAGERLDEVLWMVPVNLKPFEDNLPSELGNYFALVFMPMPLDHEDRFARLDAIHHRMERIKNSDEAVMTFGLQKVVSTSPSQVAYRLTNFFANKAVGVLTNVPGPVAELTFAGVPVTQVVGFAPCSGNQPMTTTIFSYNGGVTVGFATDAALVPDSVKLVDYVVAELAAMGVDSPAEMETTP